MPSTRLLMVAPAIAPEDFSICDIGQESSTARIFHTAAETASGCSRRRQSALTSFPRKSAPTDLGGYSGYERSGLGFGASLALGACGLEMGDDVTPPKAAKNHSRRPGNERTGES